MISFNFNIYNPQWCGFKTIFCKNIKLTKNKNLEIGVYKSGTIIGMTVDISPWGSDHTPIGFEFGLFCRRIEFTFYDRRHWDDENNCYEKYD